MKKNRFKDQEEKRKPRRLRLNRETIRLLSDPALLGVAKGGASDTCWGTTIGCTCRGVTDSCVNENCIPTDCSGRATGTTTHTEAA
jgi:hypothetical protein